MHEQHSQFTDLVYDNPKVFFLHEEDLRHCDYIRLTINITLDRPFYLHTLLFPYSSKGKVCKCFDTQLQQGIIRQLQSPSLLRWSQCTKIQGKFVY